MKRTGIRMQLEIPWSQGEHDFDVLVSGYYHPGRPARISGPPEDCYPEEPSDFEVDQIACSDAEEHAELDGDEAFWETVYIKADETYWDMLDEQRSEQAAERAYWRDYDTGRS